MSRMQTIIQQAVETHSQTIQVFFAHHSGLIVEIANQMIQSIQRGGAIYWCGNGGSAADAQHLAAELVGRFKRNRPAIRSAALHANTSTLTALANDFGYHTVFQRQIEAWLRPGDVVVGLSTSGNSQNVLLALQKAKEMGGFTVGLLGHDGGAIKTACDIPLIVTSHDTARIQEVHITVGHIICELVEEQIFFPNHTQCMASNSTKRNIFCFI